MANKDGAIAIGKHIKISNLLFQSCIYRVSQQVLDRNFAQKFVKVCLHSSQAMQNSLQFEDFFNKYFKILFSQGFEIFILKFAISNSLEHPVAKEQIVTMVSKMILQLLFRSHLSPDEKYFS